MKIESKQEYLDRTNQRAVNIKTAGTASIEDDVGNVLRNDGLATTEQLLPDFQVEPELSDEVEEFKVKMMAYHDDDTFGESLYAVLDPSLKDIDLMQLYSQETVEDIEAAREMLSPAVQADWMSDLQ